MTQDSFQYPQSSLSQEHAAPDYLSNPNYGSAPSPSSHKQRRLWPWITGTAIVSLILGFVIGWPLGNIAGRWDLVQQQRLEAEAEASARASVLRSAVNTCSLSNVAELGDNGRTLTFHTRGDENPSGGSLTDLSCLLSATDAPDSVRSRMSATRALDGMQTANWNGIEASWTYHPDSGLTLILTQQ